MVSAMLALAYASLLLVFLGSSFQSPLISFSSVSSPSLSSSSKVNHDSHNNYQESGLSDVASHASTSHRRLVSMPYSPESVAAAAVASPLEAAAANDIDDPSKVLYIPDNIGHHTSGPVAVINMFRRAKDVVDESDVPFLLQIPHTSSETLHDIMTQCYGLVGKHYDSIEQLERARRENVVDSYYVSSHDRPARMFKHFGERFHFLSTQHYQEGAALLTMKHRGRVILMLRHPVDITEDMYYSRPGTTRGDIDGLIGYVNSTEYYDNWMTRMLANVPGHVPVTEDHYRTARQILENKFLIGMTSDIAETVQKRLKLYFGWKELPEERGCEIKYIKRAVMNLPSATLEWGSHWWRHVRAINHYDHKLFVRAQHTFGNQKMRVPIHSLVREEEKKVVNLAFAHLRDVKDERDSSDVPFFWHIPKASGTTVKEILSNCYGLIRTEMIQPPSSLKVFPNKRILNVDLSTPSAIAVAKNMRVADRGLADVFVSQLSLEGSNVFSTYHMGRAFTIMRHPVKLAASLFYYRRIATWEPTYRPDYKDITLKEYVEQESYYDNWMVRMLTNAKLGGLNENHLDLAKRILKDKFIVGISDHMDETFRQLELYYGWAEDKEGCTNFHLHSAPSNKNKYPVPERSGDAWNLIAEKNKYDMSLYYYALELFGDQSEKMFREEKTVEVQ